MSHKFIVMQGFKATSSWRSECCLHAPHPIGQTPFLCFCKRQETVRSGFHGSGLTIQLGLISFRIYDTPHGLSESLGHSALWGLNCNIQKYVLKKKSKGKYGQYMTLFILAAGIPRHGRHEQLYLMYPQECIQPQAKDIF